ncbi:helix-turn-helix domain-containing protein [Fluviispira sanaruensis]|uniref:HTH cro/C1-type domain-containing protein n=1 Tax=Fluviispira sanaruensis TaxID=2493639 RepID=A0A4P2VNX3_FLUSA|nr:helix-turn-helix transcriptional regulator [Fluviispira sanaruensis]BBH54648.1 hypothetical protein JCM31447_31220 [Fluviispira sanaruensis]
MIISGTYGEESNIWIAYIKELNFNVAASNKAELFQNIRESIKQLDKKQNFFEVNDNADASTFQIKFINMSLFSAFVFKSLRNKEKVSQYKIADKLNVSRTSYSQYEVPTIEPTLTKFFDILKALGYEVELNIKKIRRL